MAARLFVVHGSHPCATVRRALEVKRVAFTVVELPPALQPPVMKALFGARTVPGVVLDGGEKVHGSRAIVHRLEELVPEPALLPADPVLRAKVEEAERWGDEVLQPIVRRLLWTAFSRRPRSMVSFQAGGRLPPLPAPVVLALAPVVTRLERRMNGVSDGTAAADLAALPAHLDRVDAWLSAGVLGTAQPNAADLQIAPSVRLLSTLGDVRALLDGRPADALARRLFPVWAGDVPAGVLTRAA